MPAKIRVARFERSVRASALAAGLLTALGVGCASEPPLRAVRFDPSNPAAPESAPLPAPTSTDAKPADGHDAGDAGDQVKALADAVYTCPMHPDIKSPKPGTCPRCGMRLQPTVADPKKAKPHDHDHGRGTGESP